jgi:hypothetical protein
MMANMEFTLPGKRPNHLDVDFFAQFDL